MEIPAELEDVFAEAQWRLPGASIVAGTFRPIEDYVAVIDVAERPVVLAGPGVAREWAVAGLHRFADRASVGVLNTWGAKGVFDWRSPHHLATERRDAAIVRRQGNRMVYERLQQLRRNLGVETIYQGQAPSRVPRILRENGVVGIVGDQDARKSGVFVPYFGRPASTHRGPALFAMRLGAPVFSCIARRMPGDEIRYEVAGERVPFEPTGVLDADVHALTAELAERLERQVRIAPEQYFWFHKRWKTKPAAAETKTAP